MGYRIISIVMEKSRRYFSKSDREWKPWTESCHDETLERRTLGDLNNFIVGLSRAYQSLLLTDMKPGGTANRYC